MPCKPSVRLLTLLTCCAAGCTFSPLRLSASWDADEARPARATVPAQAVPAQAAPGADTRPEQPGTHWRFLTGARTFDRLLADQRWPAFSVSYRFQDNGRHLDRYEHLAVGDSMALARGPITLGGREVEMELGIQGAIFSIFDPDVAQSLITIDYVAGAYAAVRRGRASGMLRLWHLSGHIGDEFLLEEAYGIEDRLPYKFEALQLLGSYDLPAGLRVYGGPSLLFSQAPDDYSDLMLQTGVEWRSPRYLLGNARPVAGVDLQFLDGDYFQFRPDLSVRAGLSFDRGLPGPAFQVLGELYSGRDPNGQLFDDRVSFAGIGVFFNF